MNQRSNLKPKSRETRGVVATSRRCWRDPWNWDRILRPYKSISEHLRASLAHGPCALSKNPKEISRQLAAKHLLSVSKRQRHLLPKWLTLSLSPLAISFHGNELHPILTWLFHIPAAAITGISGASAEHLPSICRASAEHRSRPELAHPRHHQLMRIDPDEAIAWDQVMDKRVIPAHHHLIELWWPDIGNECAIWPWGPAPVAVVFQKNSFCNSFFSFFFSLLLLLLCIIWELSIERIMKEWWERRMFTCTFEWYPASVVGGHQFNSNTETPQTEKKETQPKLHRTNQFQLPTANQLICVLSAAMQQRVYQAEKSVLNRAIWIHRWSGNAGSIDDGATQSTEDGQQVALHLYLQHQHQHHRLLLLLLLLPFRLRLLLLLLPQLLLLLLLLLQLLFLFLAGRACHLAAAFSLATFLALLRRGFFPDSFRILPKILSRYSISVSSFSALSFFDFSSPFRDWKIIWDCTRFISDVSGFLMPVKKSQESSEKNLHRR